jgi:hypothetical protein
LRRNEEADTAVLAGGECQSEGESVNFLRRILGPKPDLLMSAGVTAGGVSAEERARGCLGSVSLDFLQSDEQLPRAVALQDVFALLLCYAAKTKWVLLSEPELPQEVFQNVFRLTLKDWPKQPYVEMISSLREEPTVFRVELLHSDSQGYFITNDIPSSAPKGDLATQYFFLLRDCVENRQFEEEEIKSLGGYLDLFTGDVLFSEAGRDASLGGLRRLIRSVNELLGERRTSFLA